MPTESDRNLSIQQKNAIDLLIVGQTDGEVAKTIGVSRQTINQWKNQDAVFVAEMNRKRKNIWECQQERLRSVVEKSIDVLIEDMSGDDLKLRQSAAIHILKAVKLYGTDHKPSGFTDPNTIKHWWGLKLQEIKGKDAISNTC